jgi:hypothetical protein
MNWKYVSHSLGVILLFMSAGFAQDHRSEVNVQTFLISDHQRSSAAILLFRSRRSRCDYAR